MIQAVSSLRTNNPKTNLKYASSVSFKGNPLSLVRDEVVLSGKVSKTVEEAAESIGKKLKGLKDELPVTRKAKTAADDMDDVDDAISSGAEVISDAVGDVVPFVGPTIRAFKTGKALLEGNVEGVIKQAGGLGESIVKQSVAVSVAAATGPLAPVTYVAVNVVWSFASKSIKKLFR